MASSEAFKVAREHAKRYEIAVAEWLQARGWFVLATYDYSGFADDKAPKFCAAVASSSLILPDLLCAKAGDLHWVEIKAKTEATLHKNSGRIDTGIALRLWRHYAKVEKESGHSVWILFAHEKEGEIRGGRMRELLKNARVYEGDEMSRGGMVFFEWNRLQFVASMSDVMKRAKV